MTITDYEYDSFLECAQKALRAVGADATGIDESVVIMEATRNSVLVNRKPHDVRLLLAATAKNTVFERLGGDAGVERMVNRMYSTALEDPRVKSFFEKNKAKVAKIKKKMVAFMGGRFGGPSTGYDIHNLRPTHYNMNVSDYHFDCIIDIIRAVLRDLGHDGQDVNDAVALLQPVRADVTTGFTVRMEIARRNVSQGTDHLFRNLNGEEGVAAMMEALFDIATADPRIKHLLLPDKERIKLAQTLYFTEALGGPRVYKGRRLPVVHADLGINDYHFDAYMVDLADAMVAQGFNDALVDEVLVTLEPVRAEVLCRSRDVYKTAEIKNGKSLLDRFGGDLNLETVVNSMYDRCTQDSRVQFHFEQAVVKQRQMRRRMYQYLSGAFGGPVQYEVSQLRPVHFTMNITDYHFDVVADCFCDTASEMGVQEEVVKEAQEVINRVRADVTTGCTVRMELAKAKTEEEGVNQLFHRLGGLEGVSRLIEQLYQKVEADKRICMFFEGAKLQTLKSAQTEFLIMALGGPPAFNGRSLEETHSVLQMTDYHLDCFLDHMAQASRDIGVDQDTVDEVTAVLEPLRHRILAAHYERRPAADRRGPL